MSHVRESPYRLWTNRHIATTVSGTEPSGAMARCAQFETNDTA